MRYLLFGVEKYGTFHILAYEISHMKFCSQCDEDLWFEFVMQFGCCFKVSF